MSLEQAAGTRNAASFYRSPPSRKAHTLPQLADGRENNAQDAAGRGFFSSKAALIPSIRLPAIQKTHAPLTDADAVSLNSP
jgi:hypothetical protein